MIDSISRQTSIAFVARVSVLTFSAFIVFMIGMADRFKFTRKSEKKCKGWGKLYPLKPVPLKSHPIQAYGIIEKGTIPM